MIFVSHGQWLIVSLDENLSSDIFLSKGDICLVLEFCSEVDSYGEPTRRSLVIHSTYGLCKTYVSLKRGMILQ